MAVQTGLQCFSDVGGWIDAVELARRHDRREERPVFCADLMSGEQCVLSGERNHPFILPMSGKKSRSIIVGIPSTVAVFGSNTVSSAPAAGLSTSRRRPGRTLAPPGSPIPVGTNPVGVAITPDGKHAYVANVNSNNVSVIDTATNTVVGTPIPVVNGPEGVAVTPGRETRLCREYSRRQCFGDRHSHQHGGGVPDRGGTRPRPGRRHSGRETASSQLIGEAACSEVERSHQCHLRRRFISMPRDEPGLVVTPGERDERAAQVLDSVEGPHPQQVLLQGSNKSFGDAIALWFTHERGRGFDAQAFDLILEVSGHV